MSESAPTRSALLELREEQAITREGYRFLDEKRVLLATEALSQLERHQGLAARFEQARGEALVAFTAMVARHGLDGVETYPVSPREGERIECRARPFLGVLLQEGRLLPGQVAAAAPGRRSAEGEAAREAFERLLERAAELAAVAANLERLRLEYRRTERRARALEDLLLPSLEARIREMSSALEEMDQEEAVRARWCHRRSGP